MPAKTVTPMAWYRDINGKREVVFTFEEARQWLLQGTEFIGMVSTYEANETLMGEYLRHQSELCALQTRILDLETELRIYRDDQRAELPVTKTEIINNQVCFITTPQQMEFLASIGPVDLCLPLLRYCADIPPTFPTRKE